MDKDWRLNGQESYLHGAVLKYKKYTHTLANDHDHCEFCWDKFSDADGDLYEGYCTPDGCHWICSVCCHDFCKQFQWRLIDEQEI